MLTGQFELPTGLDLLAIAAFALPGALAAVRRHHDIVGLFFLAPISGCGGGLFTREEPLAFKPGQFYVLVASLGAVVFVAAGTLSNAAAESARSVIPAALGI